LNSEIRRFEVSKDDQMLWWILQHFKVGYNYYVTTGGRQVSDTDVFDQTYNEAYFRIERILTGGMQESSIDLTKKHGAR
jgi:hypothetical protein